MKHPKVAALLLAAAVAASACADGTEPMSPDGTETFALQATASQSLSIEDGVTIERSEVLLPEGAQASHPFLADLEGAIDGSQYECTGSTEISDWWLARAYDIIDNEPSIFDVVYGLAGDLVTMYDALYFQTDATPQYFGYDGQYTDVLLKTHKDAKRFWDIPSDGIQLLGMHGTMLTDVERVSRVYRLVFGFPAPEAQAYADMMRDAVLASETVNGGNHPLFSFNAFAIRFSDGTRKIVLGDGILDGYEALGYADVAPQAVHMHEFAHHVQFANGYFDDMGSREENTRYSELMADAMSAYYLTHKRGATMNQKRVEQFLEVFFQIGDCSFASPGHHGTPNQRMRAARFGFQVADDHQVKGHILPADEFYELFVEAYPDLIAPDAI